jgi:hypothetical protein
MQITDNNWKKVMETIAGASLDEVVVFEDGESGSFVAGSQRYLISGPVARQHRDEIPPVLRERLRTLGLRGI